MAQRADSEWGAFRWAARPLGMEHPWGSAFPLWKETFDSWPRGEFEGELRGFHLRVGHSAASRLDVPDAF